MTDLKEVFTRSNKARDQILQILSDKDVATDTRTTLLAGYMSIALEHHEAIMLLIEKQLYGSASALARPVFESWLRALWVYGCASPEEVEKISTDDGFKFPEMQNIVKAIDKKYKGDGFFYRIKGQFWKTMSSYNHSGLLAISRRFTGHIVQPNYDDGELIELIRSTTMVSLLFSRLVFLANNIKEGVGKTEEMILIYTKQQT